MTDAPARPRMATCDDAPPEVWDRIVLGLPAPHLLQGYDWGALKSRWGWSVHRVAWSADDRTVAAAQILTRRLGRTPVVVGDVPKGPLVSEPLRPESWGTVLGDLAEWARRTGLTLLKIDPDVPRSAGAVARAWASRGWRASASPIQFPNTMSSDLTGGVAAMLAAMHPKTRYNIGLAGRRGVSVRHAGQGGLDAFHALYTVTGARGGFGLRARAYYVDAWRMFLARGRATVILAEREGMALAGVIPVRFGPTAWFLYGASGDTGREHMPAFLAQWESLCWAMTNGCQRYDWWGGPTVLSPEDPLWGVYRFKHGFGAEWVEHLGAWDLPVHPVRYAVYARLDRWRRARLRERGMSEARA